MLVDTVYNDETMNSEMTIIVVHGQNMQPIAIFWDNVMPFSVSLYVFPN